MSDPYPKPSPIPPSDDDQLSEAIVAVGRIADHLGIDDETVSWGLFSIAKALDRLADAVADATKTPKQPPRR